MALRLELNQLLKDIPANRAKIFLAMHDLAVCKARRFHFQTVQDREDIVSESVMFVMGRLHKYNSSRHAACAYFGLMLHRQMGRLARKLKDQNMVHDRPGNTRSDGSALDSAPNRRLPRRTAGRWRNTQVRDQQDRDRVKDVLDEALSKACAFADAYGNDTDADGSPIDGAQLAIGVLQHVRKALLGRFNRIEMDNQVGAATPPDAPVSEQ
jgi:hypothetical protein